MDDERALPTNSDAERFVLGAILLDDSHYPDVAAKVTPDDFSLEKHRRILKRMGALAARGERIDRVTVANELMKFDELESVDGLSYLVSLDDGLPQIPNLDSYVRIIRELATLRRIVFASQNLIGAAVQRGADPDALLKRAGEQFLALADTQEDDGLQTPHEIIEEEIARVGISAFLDGGAKGIQTPLPWLNATIVGLQKGDLVLIGARPSVGKTALALQSAHRAARDGHGCVFFSREMGKLPLSIRIACSVSNVDSHRVRTGTMDSDERERFMDAIQDLKGLPLWIDKSSATVDAMHAKIRRARTRVQVDLAVVDYIQLMATDGHAENMNVAVSAISRGLKQMAEEFQIPVVALSQLSRPPKGQNPRPQLSDLRDSGSLEQDADVVLFIHDPEGKLGTGRREIGVAKQRNGPVDWSEVTFVGQYQRFEEMERGRE